MYQFETFLFFFIEKEKAFMANYEPFTSLF